LKSQLQPIQINQQQGMLILYDKYAAMLLGYIYEIVKDHELAEQYMVRVFKSISDKYLEVKKAKNTWCKLQQLAKNILVDFCKTEQGIETLTIPNASVTHNKLIDQMNNEQRIIFCAIYYQGKTTAQLVVKLNKSELTIRKTLKEAFAIIRKSREYTGVH
jgi:DNA-directed RNA polymerase specialized sigma24 family protein